MRVEIEVDERLHREMEIQAVLEGLSVGRFVPNAIRSYLRLTKWVAKMEAERA